MAFHNSPVQLYVSCLFLLPFKPFNAKFKDLSFLHTSLQRRRTHRNLVSPVGETSCLNQSSSANGGTPEIRHFRENRNVLPHCTGGWDTQDQASDIWEGLLAASLPGERQQGTRDQSPMAEDWHSRKGYSQNLNASHQTEPQILLAVKCSLEHI